MADLRRWRAAPLVLLTAVTVAAAALAVIQGTSSSGTGVPQQFSSAASIRAARSGRPPGSASGVVSGVVSGRLEAPGGPYLRDRFGRVVILHGVNVVYKHAPWTLEVEPDRPWSFTAWDAATIARLGFNVVRLGILWRGLEPGHGGVDNPAVCRHGAPGDPHFFSATTAARYVDQVAHVVDLLGRYHVYTLLDMHQDLFSTALGGEGAPPWAVCTDGVPIHLVRTGRWSRNYADGALREAVDNFWENDVVGDIQGQFDHVWAVVAHRFRDNPWVVGYDPYNEPFELEVHREDARTFAMQLECFYTGRSHPGLLAHGTRATCPPDDPAHGVVASIEDADPGHPVFVEPDVYSSHGAPSLLGPMDLPNLVYNFHAYCPDRNPDTGNPRNPARCADDVLRTVLRRSEERPGMASPAQPGGPAWFMSEFGATDDKGFLAQVADDADVVDLGWTEWAWKRYDDPTGSSAEELVGRGDHLRPSVHALSRTYAQAIAGTPISTGTDPATGAFDLDYTPDAAIHAPTVVFVPAFRYPYGYCTTVEGGDVVSTPGAAHLLVNPLAGASPVDVSVIPGQCR